jgi:hypothetical protein
MMNGLTVAVADQMRARLIANRVPEENAENIMDELAEIAVEGVVKLWREGDHGIARTYPEMPVSKEEWEAHCAFYRLAVDQRDRAWRQIEDMKHKIKTEATELLELAE